MIGNPPWVFTREGDFAEASKSYIQKIYLEGLEGSQTGRAKQSGKINLFAIFILQSLRLLKNGGFFGNIVPNNLLRATVYDIIRKHILDTSQINEIADLGAGVFKKVTASTIIFVLQKGRPNIDHMGQVIEGLDSAHPNVARLFTQGNFLSNTSFAFSIYADSSLNVLLGKFSSSTLKLGGICIIHAGGIATGPGKNNYISNRKISDMYKPLIEGKDVKRYFITFRNRFILYDRQKLYRARDESIFLAEEKIVTQRIGGGGNSLVVGYDDQQYYTFNSTNTILRNPDTQYSLKYILAILNSKLLNWYYNLRYTNRSQLTVNISKTFLEQLPIRTIDFSSPADVARHDRMVVLVESMLDLHKQLANTKTAHEREVIERQIEATDSQIDKLVNELYELTDEEIKIIEEATNGK